MITKGTLDEKIDDMLRSKKAGKPFGIQWRKTDR